MAVDGQLVARTVAELRAMPEAGDLLARLERVVEATRTVVGVDGTGLTLICEDGLPRWVAVGVTLDQAFERLRGRARASCRLAEVAQEVVQDAQRERVAAKARDDARVRAAEGCARAAEQALQAAETGLARRTAALDRAEDVLAAGQRAADQRNHVADQRDRAADDRNHLADARERAADVRDRAANQRDRAANQRDRAANQRDRAAEARDQATHEPE